MVGGDTFSRLLVAPTIVPEKKVAMSPSSTTVHEGQYDISRVSVSWLIRAGDHPLLTNTICTVYNFLVLCSPSRAVNFKESNVATFYYRT